MGFVKQGLAVRGFLVVVGCLCEGDWESESCLCSRGTATVASGVGSKKSASAYGSGCFFRSVSCSVFQERPFLLPRAICDPQASEKNGGAGIMRYSGRAEERAPSIYRSSVFVVLSDGGEGAPFQSFLKGLDKDFLIGRDSFSGSSEGSLLRAARVGLPGRARWPFSRDQRPEAGPARQWLSCARPRRLCDCGAALPIGAPLDRRARHQAAQPGICHA